MADPWNRGHGAVEDMLDAENKLLAENLASKVSRMKSLAYDIDKEAEDQNTYLDGMCNWPVDWKCEEVFTMVRSGRDNRKIQCYVSVVLVMVFFLLYYLVSRMQN